MNLQKNMEAIFFVAAITSVTALAAAEQPAPQVQYVENTIATEMKPALIVVYGKRPTVGEKVEYHLNNFVESFRSSAI